MDNTMEKDTRTRITPSPLTKSISIFLFATWEGEDKDCSARKSRAHIHNSLPRRGSLHSIHEHYRLLDIAKDQIHVAIVSLRIKKECDSVCVRMNTQP